MEQLLRTVHARVAGDDSKTCYRDRDAARAEQRRIAWRMKVDAAYDISLTIDDNASTLVEGIALSSNNLEIDLEDEAALFSRIRAGCQLTVIAAD